MADEIFSYASMWAGFDAMEDAHKESVRVQILNIVKSGVPLAGVTELVFGAPVEFKEQAWKLWAASADLSGYHLKDVLALSVTETSECVYPILSKWARTAKLAKCSVKDILKIGESLTDYNDFVAVWRNWGSVVAKLNRRVVTPEVFIRRAERMKSGTASRTKLLIPDIIR